MPVFAFTLKDGIDNFTVFDVSNALRERGSPVHDTNEGSSFHH